MMKHADLDGFNKELTDLLNKQGVGNNIGVPDHALASLIVNIIYAVNFMLKSKEEHKK